MRTRDGVLGSIALAALLLGAAPGRAFEFFDGRIQIHGYFSNQVRAFGRDFDLADEVELTQWQHLLSVEFEADLAPGGIGPLEILEFFARVEARYDCIWTHACHLSSSVETYGDEARHFPKRLIDGRLAGFGGALRNSDTRRYAELGRLNFELWHRNDPPRDTRTPLLLSSLPGFVNLFGNGDGANAAFDPITGFSGDDPPPFHFFRILDDCKFGVKKIRGGEDGLAAQIMGPWNPDCNIREIAAFRGNPNPFSWRDFNPILAGVDRIPGTADDPDNPNGFNPIDAVVPRGRGALPFRPAPLYANDDPGAPNGEAQGLFYPSAGLRRAMRGGELDNIQQNFSQTELSWNHGASQQDERELKEAYFDLEAAEGRLWMRLGKQTIVWGKTELFRNTDQFNPQDLALSSLPGLEESRIGQWALRGTWSFYNIGKLEDVRLELALNLDDYEPADLGRCGEPYSFDLVCNLTFGYFAHGITGAGLAGNATPPNPWEDVEGVEVGARVEFRYKRFSFQISDFYGYDDFPFPRRIFTYARNVDPATGMPRRAGARGPCTTGDSRLEPACLGRPDAILRDATTNPIRARDWDRNGIPDDVTGDGVPDLLTRGAPGPIGIYYRTGELIVDPAFQQEVLTYHPSNQTLYAMANILCGATQRPGAPPAESVDPGLCGFVTFNGKEGQAPLLSTVAQGASGVLAGSPAALLSAVNNNFLPNVPTLNQVMVRLHQQPGDATGVLSDGGVGPFSFIGQGLGQVLTPQQEALLGCGPFFLADCDDDGIDFLNAEASILLQSWPGFDGSVGSADDWRVDTGPQPGTVDFALQVGGGPVATRFENGQYYRLPGSRGYLDELGNVDLSYDPAVDGCAQAAPGGVPNAALCTGANIVHPETDSPFRTELAALSWNFMMTVALRSDPRNPDLPALSEFDENDPMGYGLITFGPNAGQPRQGLTAAQIDGVTPVACGLLKPQLCENVRGLLGSAGASRNDVRAAGNSVYGRRDFAWHSSGELVLDYEKRNVLGFAFDFAEDRSKTNWGVEATWVDSQPFLDNDEHDGIRRSSTLNLTVSADRPTFINFLNSNRTFLFNTQWFFQYVPDYRNSFAVNGPLNALATFTIFTGYHQDRLLLFYTGVFDFASSSGAVLPQVIYRFTESFSASLGMNFFFGRQQFVDSAISELRAGLNRTGRHAYKDAVENGLSALRDRDEFYMTVRYTF